MIPRMMAIGRSRLCPHSQRKPSASSTRHGLVSRVSWPSGRNVPGIRNTSAAATKNDAASRKNGSENATASRSDPSGGPANWLATPSALHIRPLAFSSWLLSTRAGIIVWPELSRSTSAMPSSNVASSTIR